MADWHGTKGMWVDRMLDPCCDFQCSPLPWPWPWIQGQILKKLYLRNGMADWHGTKGMWVDRMLASHCDFKLWPHPWPWPWIFKVKYWNYCNSGMGGLTRNERGVGWIWCWMRNGIDLGHGAWQIDQPSNGSMWNSYSFHPVGQWMGYSFTDLGAEGCCRSLNALGFFQIVFLEGVRISLQSQDELSQAFSQASSYTPCPTAVTGRRGYCRSTWGNCAPQSENYWCEVFGINHSKFAGSFPVNLVRDVL